ncbi:hypothetical protein MMPV_009266 [Pyropia vietnamensis]
MAPAWWMTVARALRGPLPPPGGSEVMVVARRKGELGESFDVRGEVGEWTAGVRWQGDAPGPQGASAGAAEGMASSDGGGSDAGSDAGDDSSSSRSSSGSSGSSHCRVEVEAKRVAALPSSGGATLSVTAKAVGHPGSNTPPAWTATTEAAHPPSGAAASVMASCGGEDGGGGGGISTTATSPALAALGGARLRVEAGGDSGSCGRGLGGGIPWWAVPTTGVCVHPSGLWLTSAARTDDDQDSPDSGGSRAVADVPGGKCPSNRYTRRCRPWPASRVWTVSHGGLGVAGGGEVAFSATLVAVDPTDDGNAPVGDDGDCNGGGGKDGGHKNGAARRRRGGGGGPPRWAFPAGSMATSTPLPGGWRVELTSSAGGGRASRGRPPSPPRVGRLRHCGWQAGQQAAVVAAAAVVVVGARGGRGAPPRPAYV